MASKYHLFKGVLKDEEWKCAIKKTQEKLKLDIYTIISPF